MDDLPHWVRLLRTPSIGPKRYQILLETFVSPDNVFNASRSNLLATGLSAKQTDAILNQAQDSADPDMEWLHASDAHHIITYTDSLYPERLKRIDSPPPLLYIQGDPHLLADPQLAIVGSRNPTQSGQDNAYQFAKYLAKQGLCITSGLALGVDGFSHHGALDATGATIAIMGTGLDRVYPAAHRGLAHQVVEKGAIVSEFPVGTPVKAANFPRRNRMISGLSVGVLVVEAMLKSGSLITARYAMEQGKEVFALPGSIHNPLARGCHHLIRQGAKLVETAEHIFEELAPVLHDALQQNSLPFPPHATTCQALSDTHTINSTTNDKVNSTVNNPVNRDSNLDRNKTDNISHDLDADEQKLLDAMGYDPILIDQIVEQTGFAIDAVSSILLLLELKGYVSACGRSQYLRQSRA